MPSRLDQIIATHRAMAAADERFVSDLLEEAEATPEPRPFRQALEMPGLSVIAEVKRRSPSAGDLNPELDPAVLAKLYETGGAACVSVLTDATFFGGSPQDLQEARSAVEIPVLRKDFTVCELDVVDARIMGADAILLIVAALEDDELWRFARLAERLGLAALFEVHDEAEIERAMRAEATILGVNQRNLHTFEIDRTHAVALKQALPLGVVTVAESGISSSADAAILADAGYDAILVGSALVASQDPTEAVRSLRGAN